MLLTGDVVHLVLVVHLELVGPLELVRVALVALEPNLLILDLTDRLFMSEDLQGQTTEPIAHSLECGQLLTRVELTLCKLVNVEAPAVHRTVLLSQLQ